MFFDEYPKEKLATMWREFAKIKQSYTSDERWSEIIDRCYKNAAFADLTMDNIIYSFYKNTYSEEDEQTCVPFVCTCIMLILAKKATIDYAVEMNIPDYEFSTYFQSTRLTTVFERTREVSELHDEFKRYEDKMKELFPEEEITLWTLFNDVETSKKFDELCDDVENFGIAFIDVFTNILAYDFVRNYMNLTNERNLNDIYEENDYDECYTTGSNSQDGGECCADGPLGC